MYHLSQPVAQNVQIDLVIKLFYMYQDWHLIPQSVQVKFIIPFHDLNLQDITILSFELIVLIKKTPGYQLIYRIKNNFMLESEYLHLYRSTLALLSQIANFCTNSALKVKKSYHAIIL